MAPKKRKPRKANEDEDAESIVLSRHEYPVVQPVAPMEGIPFGLELLVSSTHLFIRPQEITEERAEMLTGELVKWDELNHYDIIDCDTGRIYFAWETDVVGLGKHRTFTLKVVDFSGRPVLQVSRNSNCLSCFLRVFNCFGSTGCVVVVNQPDGTKLGELRQKYNGWTPKFMLRNEFEKEIMTIAGPVGSYCCYNCNMESSMMIEAEFPIFYVGGEKIGSIHKGSPDPMENIDTFGIRFPQELPVEQKATLLGAIFAINFMFFERKKPEPDIVEVYEEQRKQERKNSRRDSYRRDLEALGLAADGTAIEKPQPSGDAKNNEHRNSIVQSTENA